MDTILFKEQILNLLNNFEYEEKLLSDITDAFQYSGKEAEFLIKFITALKILNEYGINATRVNRKMFEKLKEAKGLFSMRLKGENFNFRIIYSFTESGAILIHGFEERAGKKKTDYSGALKIVKSRIGDNR